MREAGRGAPMGSGGGATSAIRRIQRELKEISASPSRHWTAAPVADDLFEWQFSVRGPPGTDFEGGIYTGRLVLPVNYPLAPPSITLLTPNGRWEVGKKICLSNTNYHADLWQPAWGIRTMIEALRSHFPVPGDGAIGAIDWPTDLRRKLAKESLDFVCEPSKKRNRELLPELSPDELREDQPEPVPPELRASAVAASDDAALELAEGLRQRNTAGVGFGTAAAPSVPMGQASSGMTAASSGGVQPPRRRREGSGASAWASRQPILMQLLKPPRTCRGWVLLVVNLLIVLLTISLILVFVDVLKHPPKLLNPLPDGKDSKE